jgi:FMN phosphatase YigB (HAD superfamily)
MVNTMRNSTIILDLDYTVFQTNMMDRKVFEPFFENLLKDINSLFSDKIIEEIVTDLWKDSWDVVIEKHKIPKEIFFKSITILESIPLNLEISTYSDYHFVKNYPIDKFLVTTGLTSLQKAKIKALNIENDFKEIIINDRLIESKTKLDIFREIIAEHNLVPEKIYVIGDNPNSEIQAGNHLNLNTIQIVRENIEKGNNAKYYINSFEELKNIIN